MVPGEMLCGRNLSLLCHYFALINQTYGPTAVEHPVCNTSSIFHHGKVPTSRLETTTGARTQKAFSRFAH